MYSYIIVNSVIYSRYMCLPDLLLQAPTLSQGNYVSVCGAMDAMNHSNCLHSVF